MLQALGLNDVSNVKEMFNFNINDIKVKKLLDAIPDSLASDIKTILKKIQVIITKNNF